MEATISGKLGLKDRLQEFKDFTKIHQYSPSKMSQNQCSNVKGHEKGAAVIQENKGLGNPEVCDSKMSISACSCGPECGPDKCDGRNRSVLVGWDSLRTKIFICLFVAFMVWLIIYVPISLTLLGN